MTISSSSWLELNVNTFEEGEWALQLAKGAIVQRGEITHAHRHTAMEEYHQQGKNNFAQLVIKEWASVC